MHALASRTSAAGIIAAGVALWIASSFPSIAQTEAGRAAADDFFALAVGRGQAEQTAALERIGLHWQPAFTSMALETIRLQRDPRVAIALIELLVANSEQQHGFDLDAWYRWLWAQPEQVHPEYPDFKAALYALIDPKFAGYFSAERARIIRLDEVVWGGVRQDGIPPLRGPDMLPAEAATYLADDNVVFGIEVNGDARAYPKRILAWHEMFVDEVGGVPVVGVYCTLCGTVILYRTELDGNRYELGTSGFLYRSNKLMYDRATQSLWSTMRGVPVIGPLVGQDIALPRMSVVTTTWGEWRRRHPETRVLSLETGHVRDYSEGEAYREYFATDELMFPVPSLDRRLDNKAQVLALLFAEHPQSPLAISAEFLLANPVYHEAVADIGFLVLTDESGANRVYQAGSPAIVEWDRDATALDRDGVRWSVSEAALTAPDGRRRLRLPAHRAFWFGWYAAFSHTRLIQ